MSAFHVPPLRVGTLDSLMQLGDELGKIDSMVEGLVRKCERQIVETHSLALRDHLARMGSLRGQAADVQRGSKGSKPDPVLLKIDNDTVGEYLSGFYWDSDQWDEREPLGDLVQHLVATAETADRELRSFAVSYQDKTARIQALERAKSYVSFMRSGGEQVILRDDASYFNVMYPFVWSELSLQRIAAECRSQLCRERRHAASGGN